MTGRPTPPIALSGSRPRGLAPTVPVPDDVMDRLAAICPVDVAEAPRAESSRDWWPLAMVWATEGDVPALAAAVARPTSPAEVAAVAAVCHDARIPLTTAAGRSGVLGGSVPVHGGVVIDICGLAGIASVDDASAIVDVAAGTFGDLLEDELRADHGFTIGHWPQSMALSTVGGWLACRSAGQMSNRYGKIEDIVVGLDVVLADGRQITTGGTGHAAVGPDLTQLFVGSEGTLGIITGARLRLHPVPTAQGRRAYGFADFDAAMEACRRLIRRGSQVAVVRLYDAFESDRHFETGDDTCVLLIADEGDPIVVEGEMRLVDDEMARHPATRLDDELVARWWAHRNDVSALEALITKGYVVDTMEVVAPWSNLAELRRTTTAALSGVEGTLVASVHQSHAYPEAACLYFTFAGQPPTEGRSDYYVACWDAASRAVLAAGGRLSHHHGVGLGRSRFMADALGDAMAVLVAAKEALDPRGILNPSKLGLPSPFGDVTWP